MARLLPLLLVLAVTGCGGGNDRPRARAIDNPYLPLSSFERCELRGGGERVVRTLLDRTRRFRVGGEDVDAAVVEDRAFAGGELVERTLDYFAQESDGTVLYLGEHVDNYEDGRVADHDGTWLYGRDTKTAGVAMPADPRVGTRFRFEDVPGITTESNTVTARLSSLRVRGKTYRDVIRIREVIQPDDEVEDKYYARGIGVIREVPPDGRVELVGCA